MTAYDYSKRDRKISRDIHKLYIKTWFVQWPTFMLWVLMRPAAMFIYYVYIPFQVAYGLQAIIGRNAALVQHYAVMLVISSLVYIVLWSLGGWAIIEHGVVSLSYVEREVFKNFLAKDYDFLSNTFAGSLSSQAVQLMDAREEYAQVMLNGFGKQAIIVVASLIIIGRQSLLLAGLTAMFVGLILLFTTLVTRWRIKYRRELSSAHSNLSGVIGDALSNAATVKSFASEDHEQRRMGKALDVFTRIQYWSWMTSIPADVGRALLATAATALLLIVTGRLYIERHISIAIVILVQLYVIKLIVAVQDITDLIKRYESVMSSAHQAMETMELPASVKDPEQPQRVKRAKSYGVDFEDVSYRYTDAGAKTFAINKFSLHIAPGEKVGLVGVSGSGKTTATKLLLRFMDVTDGSVSINDVDIRDLAQHDLRNLIAYVPQEPLLFHRSVGENIHYGKPSASKRAMHEAAALAYVDEFVADFPKGFDTLVGEKGIKLSGGQRQRVAIARALIKQAPILVLDEATSALDSESEQYIQKALRNLMKDRTALVIAHRLSTIKNLDRIVVMRAGKVIEEGTHNQLLKRPRGIYAKLWRHQTGGYLADVK